MMAGLPRSLATSMVSPLPTALSAKLGAGLPMSGELIADGSCPRFRKRTPTSAAKMTRPEMRTTRFMMVSGRGAERRSIPCREGIPRFARDDTARRDQRHQAADAHQYHGEPDPADHRHPQHEDAGGIAVEVHDRDVEVALDGRVDGGRADGLAHRRILVHARLEARH